MRVQEAKTVAADRLAIRPYPRELEEVFTMRDGRKVILRPIRPEDEPNHHVFVSRLTPEDIRFRFFGLVQELPHSQMARLTQIDYDREMAFIGVAKDDEGNDETLGVVRTVTDPDNETAEFSIVGPIKFKRRWAWHPHDGKDDRVLPRARNPVHDRTSAKGKPPDA